MLEDYFLLKEATISFTMEIRNEDLQGRCYPPIWETKQSMSTFQTLIVITELEQSSQIQFWKSQFQRHRNVTPRAAHTERCW